MRVGGSARLSLLLLFRKRWRGQVRGDDRGEGGSGQEVGLGW